MKNEILLITQQLETLKKSYNETNSPQCAIMQHNYKKEYSHIKQKLKALENLANSNPNNPKKSITNLQHAVALLGLYLMV